MKHNNKNCTGCMKCVDACLVAMRKIRRITIKKDMERIYSDVAEHVSQRCMMCHTTRECDAAKVCENGCFEVVV